MVLHMLRKKIGDVDFYQGIKNYLSDSDHAFAYAKSEDFISIMEAASGKDLTEFFSDWLYNQGHPSYTVNWYQPNPSQVKFEVNQTQSHPSVSYFEAPIPIRIHGTGGETLDVVLDNTTNNEEFFEAVTFPVSSVEFDPERDLVSKNNTVALNLDTQILRENLKLYPNPAKNLLFLDKPDDLEIYSIKLYSNLGQFLNEYDFSKTLELENLSTGLYLFVFESDQGVFHKTLLKQ